MMKQYETVFIVTPVLSEEQMKETVEKFRNILISNEIEILHEENWGLRKLAYPIKNKNTGYYQLFEFKADPEQIRKLEIEYRRDEKIIRFLTFKLDKHAIAYSEKRRKLQNKETVTEETEKKDN